MWNSKQLLSRNLSPAEYITELPDEVKGVGGGHCLVELSFVYFRRGERESRERNTNL